MHASERPTFDYSGSLEFASTLYSFTDKLETANTSRGRVANLDFWLGPSGDNFRERAASEDRSTENTAAVLRDDAQQWAKVWLRMVNDMNSVVFAEARDAQAAFIEANKQDDGWGFGDVVGAVVNPVGTVIEAGVDLYGYATGGQDLSFAAVPEPTVWQDPDDVPQPPGFVPGSLFVHYQRNGGEFSISGYQQSPPPPGWA